MREAHGLKAHVTRCAHEGASARRIKNETGRAATNAIAAGSGGQWEAAATGDGTGAAIIPTDAASAGDVIAPTAQPPALPL
jgi:hypothetical protein